MGYSKIEYNGEILIDLSGDSVTSQVLKQGFTAHNANGDPIVGTMTAEGSSSGSGGGIIDVTELPTSNIDGNAVYRLTESVQTNITEVYIVDRNSVITAQQYLASLGVPTTANIYVVDELTPDLKITDVQYYTEVNLYILRSDGICYMNVPAFGGFITLGLLGMQTMGYDKGFTDDVYAETEMGIYTTLETHKEVIRYFIRKSGKWEEISAITSETLPNGCTSVDVLTGEYFIYDNEEIENPLNIIDVKRIFIQEKKIPSRVFSSIDTASIIDGTVEDIPEGYFIKSNGQVVNTIRSSCFAHAYNLQNINIPYGVTSLGSRAFYSSGLINISLPESLTTIYNEAFRACGNLANISIPNSVTSIEYGAFEDCYELTSIAIPDGITVIRHNMFQTCHKLSSVLLPDSINVIENNVFAGCQSLTSILLPSGLTSIGNQAFEYCYELTSIAIPDSVVTLSGYAFRDCKKLSSVTLSNNIDRIEYNVFDGCTSLSTITFKNKIGYISSSAFSNCINLTTINVPWSEGEVAYAPWGATNATINYNYTEG